MKNMILMAMMAGGILLYSSCEKDKDVDSSSEKNGSMDVQMTDAPANYEALMLSITKVEVYQDGQGWIDLNHHTQSFNVLDLNNGKSMSIASSSSLDVGVYTKLRVVFNQNAQLTSLASIGVLGSNLDGTFNLNWTASNTVEVEINEQVSANSEAKILLDFNVAESIVEDASSFFINPVITNIEDQKTGIDGQVSGSNQAMILVSDGNNELSTSIAADGSFQVKGLESGNYEIDIDYLVEVSGQMEYRRKTISNVTVVEGQITSMGSIVLD